MAHPDELARELIKTTHGLAQRSDAKQVNDKPGYMANHGNTVDEQGRVIYRSPSFSAGAPAVDVALHSGTSQSITSGASEVELLFTSDTAGWLDTGTNIDLVMPSSGVLVFNFRLYWVTGSTTGTRKYSVNQYRDSVSAGYLWDNREGAYNARTSSTYFDASYWTVIFTEIVAGDRINLAVAQNSGSTLSCQPQVFMMLF